jgi:hypothetical protein
VVEHGLPLVPPVVNDGEYVPVARWLGDGYGAVLHLRGNRQRGGGHNLENGLDICRWLENRWQSSPAGGGTGWHSSIARPAGMPADEVRRYGIRGHAGLASFTYCLAYGVAGTAIRTVEIERMVERRVERANLESAIGAWIVGWDTQSLIDVRFLDAEGSILALETFGSEIWTQRLFRHSGPRRPRRFWWHRRCPECGDRFHIRDLVGGKRCRWCVFPPDGLMPASAEHWFSSNGILKLQRGSADDV